MNEEHDSSNVHQHYVNAELGDDGIPEYFKRRLDTNSRHDLLQEAVFRELWYSADSIHSLGSLESRFEETRQTVGSRLDEMVERGLLKKASINNGDYWWINFPESKQPLPADAVVYRIPEDEEATVTEFFNQFHVQIGVISLMATVAGGAIVWYGTLQSTGVLSLPVPATEVLSVGLSTLFISYLLLLLAVVTWVVQKAFSHRELPFYN